MTDAELRDAVVGMRHWSPWTISGTPDPDVTEPERASHHALLTGPELLTCFRRAFPEHADADYDVMIRLLGYVWDCPYDATANMTGYCCSRCGRTRQSIAIYLSKMADQNRADVLHKMPSIQSRRWTTMTQLS